jgi:hypothetical protein
MSTTMDESGSQHDKQARAGMGDVAQPTLDEAHRQAQRLFRR